MALKILFFYVVVTSFCELDNVYTCWGFAIFLSIITNFGWCWSDSSCQLYFSQFTQVEGQWCGNSEWFFMRLFHEFDWTLCDSLHQEVWYFMIHLQVMSLHTVTRKFVTLISLLISKDDIQVLEVDWKRDTIEVPIASKLRILTGNNIFLLQTSALPISVAYCKLI